MSALAPEEREKLERQLDETDVQMSNLKDPSVPVEERVRLRVQLTGNGRPRIASLPAVFLSRLTSVARRLRRQSGRSARVNMIHAVTAGSRGAQNSSRCRVLLGSRALIVAKESASAGSLSLRKRTIRGRRTATPER